MVRDETFYIRLTSDEEISRSMVKEWLDGIKDILSKNTFSGVSYRKDDGSSKKGLMTHKITKSGTHVYEIPLSRELSEREREIIKSTSYWICGATNSILDLSGDKSDSISIESDQYLALSESIAKTMHQKWLHEQSDAGWSYGVLYSQANKTHPMMRPWEDLPERYRKVDYELPKILMKLFSEHGYIMISKYDLNKWLKS